MHDEIDDDDICENDEADEIDDEVLESALVIIITVLDDEPLVHDNERTDELQVMIVQTIYDALDDDEVDDIHKPEYPAGIDLLDDVDLQQIYLEYLVHIDDEVVDELILDVEVHEHDDADEDEPEQIQIADEMLRIIDDEVAEMDITDDVCDIDVNE